MKATMKPIPVILDTDIGNDIDDTWALAMLLKSPELDVKLIVSATGDTLYRTKIIARMLEIAGRTDIPVGVGVPFDHGCRYSQAAWVEGYALARYPGTLHRDGVGAIVDTLMNAPEPVTLICIGPVPNIAEALRREPRIAQKARFVGMHGSVRKGYRGAPDISKECNVLHHTDACQLVFRSAWDMTITPVDTCGIVVLRGEKYQAVRHCSDPVIQALMENYRHWLAKRALPADQRERESSILFDTVAIYLAFAQELVVMEDLGIRVSDDAYTLIDPHAKRMHVATEWRSLDAFEDLLVSRLTGTTPPR